MTKEGWDPFRQELMQDEVPGGHFEVPTTMSKSLVCL